jgi:hypothetical protein
MKNLIFHFILSAAFLIIGNQAIAQELMIENEKISYDDQFRTSIKVTMEPNKKEVRTSWENWLEDKYDTKVHGANWLSKKDVLSAERIKIPIISDQQFDLYAKVVDKGQGSQLSIFASFGYDVHITPETFPKEYQALENLTLNFLTDFLTNYYQNRAEDSQKLVGNLENDKNNLQEDISKNKKEIEALKEKNTDLENQMTSKSKTLDEAAKKLKEVKASWDQVNDKLKAEKKAKTKLTSDSR